MKLNLFIDTSVFIAENFFHGKKLERIGMLANQGKINVFITSVVEEELKSNISKRVKEVHDANNKFKRELEYKHKIVKNIFNLEEIVFSDKHLETSLLEKFGRFKEFARIEVIHPKEKFDIKAILDKYFNNLAPFNVSEKKCEFPDAISLKIIEDYCETNNIKAIHLSSDKDFEGLLYQNIEFKNDFGELIIDITKSIYPDNYKDEELVYDFIRGHEDTFIELIKYEIQLELLVYFHSILDEGIDLNTDDIKVNDLNISEYSVFDIKENYVSFICKGNYKSTIPQKLNFRLSIEELQERLNENNFVLKKNKFVEVQGLFEMTLHYSYEYAYKAIEDTIEFDEDERKIKSIEDCI